MCGGSCDPFTVAIVHSGVGTTLLHPGLYDPDPTEPFEALTAALVPTFLDTAMFNSDCVIDFEADDVIVPYCAFRLQQPEVDPYDWTYGIVFYDTGGTWRARVWAANFFSGTYVVGYAKDIAIGTHPVDCEGLDLGETLNRCAGETEGDPSIDITITITSL
jgi:hypothetical protein